MHQWLKKTAGRVLSGFLAALAFSLAADVLFALLGMQPSGKRLALVFAAVLLPLLLPLPARVRKGVLLSLPVLCLLAAAGCYAAWRSTEAWGGYREADNGKAALYAGKNVMLIVPHEDDDLNLLGGVIEQYVKYGSRVRVVFTTNGDLGKLGEARINEAIAVWEQLGVPEEDVIFLGYGDRWSGDVHLYNAPLDLPMTSGAGYTETYGTPEHPAYHNGNPYTHRNMREDLKSVLLQFRPDVLFACDYDPHQDHQAASLFFEEALGQILAEQPDYRPTVLKGFTYSTAYYSVPDYYQANILSTKPASESPYMSENGVYLWADRVRLPVLASTLSRSLLGSGAYEKIALYSSQDALEHAPSIINGDKVFWVRDTGSLSYTASVTATSGEAWRLNDFKLADSGRLEDNSPPLDGVWAPLASDAEKTAVLKLSEKVDLSLIRLYGTYPGQGRVLDALLTFDDGSQLHTGSLPEEGGALELQVDKSAVSQVSVTLLETEGEGAGLSEIELYSQRPETDLRYIKLQNEAGDFVYDYYIDADGQEDFTLYAQGCPAELTEANYRVSVDGQGCAAEIAGGKLRVTCPRGKHCTVTVESLDGSVSDSVTLRSPLPVFLFGQRLESVWPNAKNNLRNSTVWVNSVNLAERLGFLRPAGS